MGYTTDRWVGYSDLGSYGGEINTPVLDDLAQQGMRYTDFYVSPTCSVTRSMLLSGTDNHVAGLGNMWEMSAPNQVGQPGYEGVLNERVATVERAGSPSALLAYRGC